MTNEELKIKLTALLSNAVIVDGKQFPEVTVPTNKLHSFAKTLKENEELSFDFLFSLSGVDYGDNLAVVYHLESIKHRHIIVMKALTNNRENPVLDSVSDIWKTADFLEREVYDLLGIRFKNHPDMRRIFLEEDWEGYPLRKDYKDDVNIVER